MAERDEQATYAINLEDGTSGPAESAAAALRSLQRQMQADTAELAALQKAMRNLQGGTSVNIAQFRQLREQIELKKQAIAGAQSSFLGLGGSASDMTKKLNPARSGFMRMKETADQLPGPLGGVLGGFAKLKDLLAGNLMTVGLVAIAAGLIAITAAAVAATASLLKYGIAQANARRSELLRIEGLTKMRSWWGLAAGNAAEMQTSIDRVSASSSLGRDKIAGYSAELYRMGLRGENLSLALEGTAIKAAALGDEGAKGFMGLAAGAALAGGSLKRLADDVRARFGRVAAAQMLDLDVQAAKLRESFAALWTGIDVEPLLKAVSSVTGLFSQATWSGRALKAVVATVFRPMIGAIEYLAPIVKRFFQGMIIGALGFAIVIARVRKWFRETFTDGEVMGGMTAQKAALYAGVAAVALLGLAFAATGVIIVGALIAAMPFIWAAVVAVGALALKAIILAAPFLLGALAVGALVATIYQLYRLWKEIDWTDLGKSIVDGIVNGLKSGAKWVIDTIKNLGKDAVGAFKSALGISSPSKAFAKLGLEIPAGVASGIESGAGDANAAAADMVGVPSAGKAGGGAVTINAPITINSSAQNASGMVADLERELVSMLERVAIQIGAAVPGGT
jgi:hypothetical protein